VLGEIALEHDLCLGLAFSSCASEFTDQPILESSPQSLDSAFGLRRTCWDQRYPELLQASAHLGGRPLVLSPPESVLYRSKRSSDGRHRLTAAVRACGKFLRIGESSPKYFPLRQTLLPPPCP